MVLFQVHSLFFLLFQQELRIAVSLLLLLELTLLAFDVFAKFVDTGLNLIQLLASFLLGLLTVVVIFIFGNLTALVLVLLLQVGHFFVQNLSFIEQDVLCVSLGKQPSLEILEL